MSFDHPNIVTAYRFGYKSGKAFLLMDYEPGYTLEQIAKGFEFTEVQLYSWMMQLVVNTSNSVITLEQTKILNNKKLHTKSLH